MAIVEHGTVKGSVIEFPHTLALPNGTEVRVHIEPETTAKALTARDLLTSDLVGMWADRKDITDSLAFARMLRGDCG